MAALTYENILRSRVEQVCMLFNANNELTNQTIANATGMHPSTTCRVMDSLIRCGICVRVHRGLYALGFCDVGKRDFVFDVPGLENQPNRIKAVMRDFGVEYFWLADIDGIPTIQEFGAFTEIAGLVSKRLTREEKLERWKSKNPSVWNSIKSYFRAGKS